jgi:hypothetical protein
MSKKNRFEGIREGLDKYYSGLDRETLQDIAVQNAMENMSNRVLFHTLLVSKARIFGRTQCLETLEEQTDQLPEDIGKQIFQEAKMSLDYILGGN